MGIHYRKTSVWIRKNISSTWLSCPIVRTVDWNLQYKLYLNCLSLKVAFWSWKLTLTRFHRRWEIRPVKIVMIQRLQKQWTTSSRLLKIRSSLKVFNDFNTNFQSEIPLLHTLKSEVERLIENVANNYIESSYVEEVDSLDFDPLIGEMY